MSFLPVNFNIFFNLWSLPRQCFWVFPEQILDHLLDTFSMFWVIIQIKWNSSGHCLFESSWVGVFSRGCHMCHRKKQKISLYLSTVNVGGQLIVFHSLFYSDKIRQCLAAVECCFFTTKAPQIHFIVWTFYLVCTATWCEVNRWASKEK